MGAGKPVLSDEGTALYSTQRRKDTKENYLFFLCDLCVFVLNRAWCR